MSLSELFKPWLGSCGACAAPRPNVALVLQYLQALRVSLTLSKKKKENNEKDLWMLRFHETLYFFAQSRFLERSTRVGRGVRRYSIGAVPRLVAPVALVRFQVAAFFGFTAG